ncbi:hypothetical protein [Pseudotenacibaculum haliotis]|uniref:Uncharacterized protein n=1 Tax=Pseudotenacibaculum haliotis TaxID=1862138 RepID=A0ABW5LWG0_9FLAO
MKILNLFKKKTVTETVEEKTPSEDLFIEKEDSTITTNAQIEKYNLERIYAFVEVDHEQKGYDDALMNPDFSYSEDNIKLLKYDLKIRIKRAYKTYEDYIKDIEFHIQTRKNAGLIDTVKLLEAELAKVNDSIKLVAEIEKEFNEETGLVERISLSYKRGFMRGLAAMSDQVLDSHV